MPMKCLTFLELYKYPVSSLYFNGTKLSCQCCFHFHTSSVAPHSACTLLTNAPRLEKKKQQQLRPTNFRAF